MSGIFSCDHVSDVFLIPDVNSSSFLHIIFVSVNFRREPATQHVPIGKNIRNERRLFFITVSSHRKTITLTSSQISLWITQHLHDLLVEFLRNIKMEESWSHDQYESLTRHEMGVKLIETRSEQRFSCQARANWRATGT